MVEWEVGEDGWAIARIFHDAEVQAIDLKGENQCLLRLVLEAGEAFEVTLVGLHALKIDGLIHQNVVSEFILVSGAQPEMSDLEALSWPPHPSWDADLHERHAANLEAMAERVRSGELSLVAIVPSFGASVLALCDRVEIDGPSNRGGLAFLSLGTG